MHAMLRPYAADLPLLPTDALDDGGSGALATDAFGWLGDLLGL